MKRNECLREGDRICAMCSGEGQKDGRSCIHCDGKGIVTLEQQQIIDKAVQRLFQKPGGSRSSNHNICSGHDD